MFWILFFSNDQLFVYTIEASSALLTLPPLNHSALPSLQTWLIFFFSLSQNRDTKQKEPLLLPLSDWLEACLQDILKLKITVERSTPLWVRPLLGWQSLVWQGSTMSKPYEAGLYAAFLSGLSSSYNLQDTTWVPSLTFFMDELWWRQPSQINPFFTLIPFGQSIHHSKGK